MPLHRRPGLILVVAMGGGLGAGLRLVISEILSTWVGAAAVATVAVNLAGTFGLGLLLQALVQAGPEGPKRRLLRLGLGTGFFGGFTTYSGLALDTVTLAGLSSSVTGGVFRGSTSGLGLLASVMPAGVYLAVSLAGGLGMALLGVRAGSRWGRGRQGKPLRGDS